MIGTGICDCGCGREFKPRPNKRFYSDECRMRWHADHTRKILDKRPRAERAHIGVEFQLDPEHLEVIDLYGKSVGCKGRSEALRRIIDFLSSALMPTAHPNRRTPST